MNWTDKVAAVERDPTAVIEVRMLRDDLYWVLSLAEEGYHARTASMRNQAATAKRPLDIGERLSIVTFQENLTEFAKQIAENVPLKKKKR